MSKFRVELDVAFDSEIDAIGFINMIEDMKDKVYKGDQADNISVVKTCRYHECWHDEAIPKQCGNYVSIDIDTPSATEHKAKDGKVYKSVEFDSKEKI